MPLGLPLAGFAPSGMDICLCRSGLIFAECCGSVHQDRKPPAGVMIFPGFLDQVTCRKWVNRLEKQTRDAAKVTRIDPASGSRLTSVKELVRICEEVKSGVLRRVLTDCIAKGLLMAVARTGRTLTWYETPIVLRYQTGGRYNRHVDCASYDANTQTWYKIRDRDLSLLLYLNDEYTGGGLTFTRFNFHYRPGVGDLLVFPSDNRYEHQAEEVLSGVRYAVACWAAFDGSTRVCDRPPPGVTYFKAGRSA